MVSDNLYQKYWKLEQRALNHAFSIPHCSPCHPQCSPFPLTAPGHKSHISCIVPKSQPTSVVVSLKQTFISNYGLTMSVSKAAWDAFTYWGHPCHFLDCCHSTLWIRRHAGPCTWPDRYREISRHGNRLRVVQVLEGGSRNLQDRCQFKGHRLLLLLLSIVDGFFRWNWNSLLCFCCWKRAPSSKPSLIKAADDCHARR